MDSLRFMINSISCFKFLWIYSGKSKWKVLGSLITSILSAMYSPSAIMARLNCCKVFSVILLCWYKRYSIFLILFFLLFELFPAFIYVDNIGSLVNSLFGIKIFNYFPFLIYSSLLSSVGMDGRTLFYVSSDFSCFLFSRY